MSYKQLSHCVLEDVLACNVGEHFLLSISKDLDLHHKNALSLAAKIQKDTTIGGEDYRISGVPCYCLKAQIDYAPLLHDKLALSMSQKQLEYDFLGRGVASD